MNNDERFPFERAVEHETEEQKVIQKVKEKSGEKGKVIDPLVEEILRLQVKRKKIAGNSGLSFEAPALIEQLDAQINRLKSMRKAGWKKEEKK
ncbi:hypothetical protein KGQ34_02350 [Patescibacteria group bacterium]|nr:hypothetical protein [Patescibacteria group bacterium]